MREQEYLIRCSSQINCGLDPYKNDRLPIGKKIYCYLKGHYFHGGPETATRFTLKDAEARLSALIDKPCCSVWLGHCQPAEIVHLDYALETDR